MNKTKEAAIEMFVGGLVLDPNTQAPVVILKDESGEINIPIWIGIPEATAIASVIKQISMARPLTHDLMSQLLGELGVTLERVLISDLKDSTYFAEIILSHGDKALILDARPSDAIALALRASAPIYVVQKVVDQARIAIEASSAPAENKEPGAGEGQAEADSSAEEVNGGQKDFQNIDKDKWNEILSNLDPDDFKYKV